MKDVTNVSKLDKPKKQLIFNKAGERKKNHTNDRERPAVITKDNIFACNLKFSNLFMRKPEENQEDDQEFITHFEKLKQQETEESYQMTTNATDYQEPSNSLASSYEYVNSDINNEIIKLIDSPSKAESDKARVNGDGNTIVEEVGNPSEDQELNNFRFQTKFDYSYMNVSNMQNMAPSNLMMIQFMQGQMLGVMPGGLNGLNSNADCSSMYTGGCTYTPMQMSMSFNNYNRMHSNAAHINMNNLGSLTPTSQNMSSGNMNNNHLHTMSNLDLSNPRRYNPRRYSSESPSHDTISKVKDYKPTNSQSLFQKYTEMSDEDLINNSKELSRDQGGCRYLQKLLDSSSSISTCLYHQLESDLVELISDSFGNYLIQKLIEKLPVNYIDKVLNIVCPNMMNLGINSHGTRVLQRLIDSISTDSQIDKFIKYFSPCVITFSNDINGNHIIQKFITTISFPNNQFIFEIIQKNIVLIGLNKHGCCALQKCIEFGTEKQRNEMINQSVKHTKAFLTDQYGNYVLQNIISYKNYGANRVIMDCFLADIFRLSKEKFSSNVIEKCMDYCDNETKEKILKKLANPEYIPSLLLDLYGNYVIQKALQISDEPYYTIFIKSIAPVLHHVKNLSFGSKLYFKFLNNYPEFSQYINNHSYDNDYFNEYQGDKVRWTHNKK